ncbi:MAG: tetratricopeptide repeat protein, partial [Candidatus Heimdallarchaeota archaeon]|nr:tetratricopeptide repeat protein [Candidatus Heimdallarchaeota archaeon]
MDPKYEKLNNLAKWGEMLDLSALELESSIEAKYWHVYALLRLQKHQVANVFLKENDAEITSYPKWVVKFKFWEAVTLMPGLGIFQKSELIQKVIPLADEIGDDETSAKCYSNLGYFYLLLGNYPQSIDYSLNGIKILENLTDDALLGLTHINLGNAYAQNGNHESSKKNFARGLDLCAGVGNVPYRVKGCYYVINELENNPSQASIEKYVRIVRQLAKTHENPLFSTVNDYCQAVY